MEAIRRRVPGEGLLEDRGPHHRGSVSDGRPRVGVLALQGDVLEHLNLLDAAGAGGVPVLRPEDLDDVDGLVIPGGESTTIGKLCALYGFDEVLRERVRSGFPVLGTCAGAVLLARAALHHDGRPSDQPLIGGMDTVVRRNAFGRQVASFEGQVVVEGFEGPMHTAFIRAPWFEHVGPGARALATVATPLGDKVVLVRQGNLLASAFHPELTGDPRLHRLFVEDVLRRRVP